MKKIFLLFVFGIFLMGIVSSATYCCEKTTLGATCQDVTDKTLCSSSSKIISTPCESTSYCKTGTCVNQQEGTCISSTQVACENNGGYWSEKSKSELPQCTLGCCLTGDSASFVTQVACNRLSTLYDADVSYKSNINDELTCLESANPLVEGACVYTKDYLTTCERTTKEDCQDLATSSTFSDVEFHTGYLCSAQELETGCGMSEETTCEGDDVYFVDTCGNLANIYDSTKVNDETYWTKINETGGYGNGAGNKDSAIYGDCDYYSGSMCMEKETGDSVNYGDYLCKNLDCEDYRGAYSGSSTGKATASSYPKHGETWCASDSQTSDSNSPGATSFRLTCYNGEVNTPEECESTRQEICLENDTDTTSSVFMQAGCVANLWKDCTAQNTKEDCEDKNVRDCRWEADNLGYSFGNETAGLYNTSAEGVCVPTYQPGFERDSNDDVVGGESCSQANSVCYVTMKKALVGDWYCPETYLEGLHTVQNNCSCLEDNWKTTLNNICTSLGDCGTKKNYAGKFGYSYKVIEIQNVSSEEDE